jgi:isochorismate synthase EntC
VKFTIKSDVAAPGNLSSFNFGLIDNFPFSINNWNVFSRGKCWLISKADLPELSANSKAEHKDLASFFVVIKTIMGDVKILLFEETLVENTSTGSWHRILVDSSQEPFLDIQEFPPIESTTLAEWKENIHRILKKIDEGKAEKIVAARTLAAKTELSRDELIKKLIREKGRFSVTYLNDFFALTPEMVHSKNGEHVNLSLLAGTDYVGNSQLPEKMDFEHDVVVKELLSRISKYEFELLDKTLVDFGSVKHYSTPIKLSSVASDSFEVLDAIYPNSTIAGLPLEKALEHISTNEGFDRGLYSGAIGWVNTFDDSLFSLGIRSGRFSGKKMNLFSGAGIVKGSNSDEEWLETEHKISTLLNFCTK